MMKRWTALLLSVLLLLAMPTAVLAQETVSASSTQTDEAASSMEIFSKVYTLNMNETQGVIKVEPTSPAFWEYPVLRAGERFLTQGTMIVRNDSDFTANMELDEIALPYGDSAKLAYLNNLHLTVMEGEEVLFDNTYVHINDADGGLRLVYENMAPGEEHVYTISMYMMYTYSGDPYADASAMSWNFTAKTETVVVEEPQGLPTWAMITVITFAVMIAILILIMIIRGIVGIVKKVKEKQKERAEQEPDEDEAEHDDADDDDEAEDADADDDATATDDPEEDAESEEEAEQPPEVLIEENVSEQETPDTDDILADDVDDVIKLADEDGPDVGGISEEDFMNAALASVILEEDPNFEDEIDEMLKNSIDND